jgi:HK97 family phage portal protein
MFLQKIRAGSDDRSVFGDFWFGPVGSPTASGQRVSGDRALQLPVVYACVRVLSESFAVLPPCAYTGTGRKRKQIEKFWLIDLLKRPNQFQNGFEWREMMQGHLAMRGNAYNQIQTDRRGNITALMPLHPDRISIEFIGQDGEYRYIYTDRFGRKQTFVRGEIWHIRGLGGDGVQGYSPLRLAAESIGLGLAAQEYGSRFFANDAKPGGGWIEYPGNFKDKAAREEFRESWQAAQSGFNRGKVAVLEYGMKFNELGMTNKESQFLEARGFQVKDIARIYRVPPHMVGDLDKSAFTNIEQQSLEFVIYTMMSWAERWEASAETELMLEADGDVDIEFDFTRLLRGDQAARGAFYHSGITDGWMTRADARDREGLEPLPGLEKPLVPLNMSTVDADGNIEQPAGAASNAVDAGADAGGNAGDAEYSKTANPRLQAMVRSNAARMARRMAGGSSLTPDALADALAITPAMAAAWLGSGKTGSEQEITESLIEVAL